ncbi:MAG: hypothetical protein JXR88_09720 [Clostridia bacterium]|nr:hypothetical protein [Clostridia bacterium]
MSIIVISYIVAFDILFLILRKRNQSQTYLLAARYFICSVLVFIYTDQIAGMITGAFLIISVISMMEALKRPFSLWLSILGIMGLTLFVMIEMELPNNLLINSIMFTNLILLPPLTIRLIESKNHKKWFNSLTLLLVLIGCLMFYNPIIGADAGTKQSKMAGDYIRKYYHTRDVSVDRCDGRRGKKIKIRAYCNNTGKSYELIYSNSRIIKSEVKRRYGKLHHNHDRTVDE